MTAGVVAVLYCKIYSLCGSALKTLRNKIHIYSSFQAKLTDYNSYTLDDYYLMRTTLYKILNNSLVSNGKFKVKEKNARK